MQKQPTEPRLAPRESRVESFLADMDVGGAPCPVLVILTTKRLLILPADPPAAPSPHHLASPVSITLAGLGLDDHESEVSLMCEDGLVRLQFSTRRKALAFTLSTRGAVRSLAG